MQLAHELPMARPGLFIATGLGWAMALFESIAVN